MIHRLARSLRQAPATVPGLAMVVLFVAWATDQAGYPLTHWAPGGVLALALLVLAAGVVGVRASEIAPPVRIALGCLAGYTALSFLSILWAAVPGDAWEGADRTLLYLIVFALFACWRQRGESAALALAAWTLALVGLAAFVLVHLRLANAGALHSQIPFGRLIYPSGYANANAALWLMAFWSALMLARSARLPWALRGLLAGGAVLLGGVALLGQSRGALYATPVMLVLVFALMPGRTRTFALLVPVAGGLGAAAPAVLRVGDHLKHDAVVPATLHAAAAAISAAALAVGLLVALGAAIETRHTFSERSRRRIRATLATSAVATLVALLAGGWVAAGDPAARISHAWRTFKGGYRANSSTGSRLISGLGSGRYDFYRVALDEFSSHPLVGIGADNFQQQYLRHGRSGETPHYPHSVEMRTLAQTGLAGALLALVGLAAAVLAGARACRVRAARGAPSTDAGSPDADPLAPAVAAAALAGFAYWLVHGSFDWFWEFAGLGAPAFALLGLACALAPANGTRPGARAGALADEPPPSAPGAGPAAGARSVGAPRRLVSARRLGLVASVCAALAAAGSLVAPWLSQLEVQSAARIWTKAPRKAYARLEDAASWNPLSDQPYLVEGSIALRFGDLGLAERKFSLALARTPDDAYATLELGAIASSEGERARALALLGRAAALNPRDPLARSALRLVGGGRRISVEELNRSILRKAQQLR